MNDVISLFSIFFLPSFFLPYPSAFLLLSSTPHFLSFPPLSLFLPLFFPVFSFLFQFSPSSFFSNLTFPFLFPPFLSLSVFSFLPFLSLPFSFTSFLFFYFCFLPFPYLNSHFLPSFPALFPPLSFLFFLTLFKIQPSLIKNLTFMFFCGDLKTLRMWVSCYFYFAFYWVKHHFRCLENT